MLILQPASMHTDMQGPIVPPRLLRRANEIRDNLDRMGIEYTSDKIDQLVRDAEKRRRIEGVREGPAEFYNDKVPYMLTF